MMRQEEVFLFTIQEGIKYKKIDLGEFNRNSNEVFQLNVVKLNEQCMKIYSELSKHQSSISQIMMILKIEDKIPLSSHKLIEERLEMQFEQLLGKKVDVGVYFVSMNKEGVVKDCSKAIHRIALKHTHDIIYHVTNEESELLNIRILNEGINQIGERFHSYLLTNNNFHVLSTNLIESNEDLLKQFQTFIYDFDYQSALRLLDDFVDCTEKEVIALLLQSSNLRFHFDFGQALTKLKQAKELYLHKTIENTTKIFETLYSYSTRETELERIHELYRQMSAHLEVDDHQSFLIRFYRVREAILLFILKYIATDSEIKPYRTSIYELINEVEKQYDAGELQGYTGIYFYMRSQNIGDFLKVRNASFIGHGRSEIDVDKMWFTYYGMSGITIAKAERRFYLDSKLMLRDLGIQLDSNIEDMNKLIINLSKKMIEGVNNNV